MNQKENNLLWLGTIVNTHGVKGEVRVLSNSDDPEMRFKIGNKLIYFKDTQQEEIVIKTMRPHKQFILLTFEGVNDINDIEWIKGSKIYCEREELSDGEYYLSDMIGHPVIDQNETNIGIVLSVEDQGPYNNLIVKLTNGKEINIPIVDEFKIEFDNNKVKVKIPKEFIL